MHDLAAEVAVAHFAEHAHALAGRERLLLARIEVEEAQHELRALRRVVGVVASRQTSCRRGRYWMSVLTTMPSACAVDAGRAARASGTTRV